MVTVHAVACANPCVNASSKNRSLNTLFNYDIMALKNKHLLNVGAYGWALNSVIFTWIFRLQEMF